jgi:hypothetical protein
MALAPKENHSSQPVTNRGNVQPLRQESEVRIPQTEPLRFEVNLVDDEGTPYLEQMINNYIKRCVDDCEKRAGLKKTRKVTITIQFVPHVRTDGKPGAAAISMLPAVDCKIPGPHFEPHGLKMHRKKGQDGSVHVTANVPLPVHEPDMFDEDDD